MKSTLLFKNKHLKHLPFKHVAILQHLVMFILTFDLPPPLHTR